MAEKVAKSFRFDAELWGRVESRAAELGQKHVMFVERALESALSDGAAGDGRRSVAPPVDESAVSTRAPVEKDEAKSAVRGSGVHEGRPGVTEPASAPSRPARDYELPKIAPRRPR